MSKPDLIAADLAGLGELNLDMAGKTPLSNLNNAVAILEHDPVKKGLIWFDEFLQRRMTGDPPREWTDEDEINLTLYVQRDIGIPRMGRDTVSQAVTEMASRDRRHCVRDWIDSLEWDHQPRIDHFFEDHFGAPGNEYTRAASRNFWISIVARVYQPGCQSDHMVVLEGPQGIKKSSALRAIGGEWFSEQHETVTGKGFFEILQGKLIVEISEMDAFSRAEVTRVKQVVTCVSDRFRESYGRHAKDHPRQCVFAGTTNRDDWNRDETGARRFWPIACVGDIDIEAIHTARPQLFAESVARFREGDSWWEMPTDATRAEQEKRYESDVWIEPISEYLKLRTDVTVNEILVEALKFDVGRISRSDQMRVATCLRSLGWVKAGNERQGDTVRKVWRPKDA